MKRKVFSMKSIISSALIMAVLLLSVGGEAQAAGNGVSLVANEEGHFDSIDRKSVV